MATVKVWRPWRPFPATYRDAVYRHGQDGRLIIVRGLQEVAAYSRGAWRRVKSDD